MGCCFSSSKKPHRSPPPSASNGRSPPPLEEETVKEVLSETPILPKPHYSKVLVNEKEADFPQVKSTESTAVVKRTDEAKLESTAVVKPSDEQKIEPTAVIKPEVSEEPSEICSFTESYSTTATGAEDGEVTQRSPIRVRRKRQNFGDLIGVRDRISRSVPSPDKRRSPAVRGMTAQRRNVGPPNGSGTVRRSKSPATRAPVDTRRNGRFRSPAGREKEKQGGQSPARKVENEASSSSSKAEKAKEEEVSPETGESLENPLVSLECFIFL